MENKLSVIQNTILTALEKGGKDVIEQNKVLWLFLNKKKEEIENKQNSNNIR